MNIIEFLFPPLNIDHKHISDSNSSITLRFDIGPEIERDIGSYLLGHMGIGGRKQLIASMAFHAE